MHRHHILLAFVGTAATLSSVAWAGTCALCRQILASGGNEGLTKGFYWSILLIAGVPLVTMTIIGLAAWRRHHPRHATIPPPTDHT